MYFSGPWKGYWEQEGFGRQVMQDLELRFDGGLIEGSGWDMVGRFIFRGRYDERGAVMLVKHYINRHDVLYHGSYDGEGTIFGEWTLEPHERGNFALTPQRAAAGGEPREIV